MHLFLSLNSLELIVRNRFILSNSKALLVKLLLQTLDSQLPRIPEACVEQLFLNIKSVLMNIVQQLLGQYNLVFDLLFSL